jgi:hypothetical protein
MVEAGTDTLHRCDTPYQLLAQEPSIFEKPQIPQQAMPPQIPQEESAMQEPLVHSLVPALALLATFLDDLISPLSGVLFFVFCLELEQAMMKSALIV